jgi:methylphosphotriester-DNA--protein-cysteine methyltransferase
MVIYCRQLNKMQKPQRERRGFYKFSGGAVATGFEPTLKAPG